MPDESVIPETPRIEVISSASEPNIPSWQVQNMCNRRLTLSLDAFRDRRDSFLDFYRAYKAMRTEDTYPWESNMVLPLVFNTIETIFPHVFAEGMRIGVRPGVGANPSKRKTWEELLDHDSRQSELDTVAPAVVKQALMYGVSPFLVTYHYDKRRMRVREFARYNEGSVHGVTVPIVRDRDVTTYDGPLCQFVDVFNWFPQPGKWRTNAPAGDGMDWCGYRFVIPIQRLLPLVAAGIIDKGAVKGLKQTNFPETAAFQDTDGEQEERMQLIGVDPLTVDDTMHQIELIVFFGDRGFGRPPGLIWMGNRKVILRDERDPFWHGQIPGGALNDYCVPGELMGMGEAEITSTYQEEKSDLRNAALDNVHQAVARIWLVDNEAEIDEAELVARPGQIIHRSAGGTVEELAKRDVPFSTYQHEAMLDKDHQQTAGALDLLHGQDQSASRPVGRTDELKAGFAAARISPKVFNLKNQFYKVVGGLFIALEQQFITQKKVIRLMGDDFSRDVIVDPADIAGNWEPIPIVDEKLPLGDYARKTQATIILQSLAPFVGGGVELDPLVIQFLEANNIADPQKYLTSWKQAQQAAMDPSVMADQALSGVQEDESRAAGAGGLMEVIQGGLG